MYLFCYSKTGRHQPGEITLAFDAEDNEILLFNVNIEQIHICKKELYEEGLQNFPPSKLKKIMRCDFEGNTHGIDEVK